MSIDDILFKHWDKKLPIDPIKIACNLGIEVYGRGCIGDEKYPYSGRVLKRDSVFLIEYNVNESSKRQRYMVAHQLAHILLNHENPVPETSTVHLSLDDQEKEANSYAFKLLIPEQIITVYYQNGYGTLDQLSHVFGVSEDAIGYRLMHLGIIMPFDTKMNVGC